VANVVTVQCEQTEVHGLNCVCVCARARARVCVCV